MRACSKGASVEVIELLIEKGALINEVDKVSLYIYNNMYEYILSYTIFTCILIT